MSERIAVWLAKQVVDSRFSKQKLVKPCHNCQLFKIIEKEDCKGKLYASEVCAMGINTYNEIEICSEQVQRRRKYIPTTQLDSFHDF